LAKIKRTSNKSIKILLVEDNAGDAPLLREKFKKQTSHSIELTHVPCMKDAEKHLASGVFEVILLDLGLPDARGMVAVRRCRKAAPQVPLVVLTGPDDESLAAQVLQEGAQDHLIKGGIETRGLLRALGYVVERKRMEEALFVDKVRAQVTLNSIGDAVICTGLGGKITFLNLAAEKMTSWTRQDAAGRIGDPLRGFGGAHPRSRRARDGSRNRLPRHQRHVGHGSADDPFGAARLPDGHAQSHAAQRPREPSRRCGAAQPEKTCGAFLGPGRIQAHQRFARSPDGRQAAAIYRQAAGGLRAHVGYLQSPGGDEFEVLFSEVAEPEDAAITARRMLQTVAEAHSINQHDLHVTGAASA
jgi:CheY-like chemotaxis protein